MAIALPAQIKTVSIRCIDPPPPGGACGCTGILVAPAVAVVQQFLSRSGVYCCLKITLSGIPFVQVALLVALFHQKYLDWDK